MSIFGTCMVKYYDAWQHQLNQLAHLREGALEMYNKVQVNSRVSQFEKDLEKAWLKWVDLEKERTALASKVRQVLKLEAKVDEMI